jgi:glutathione S-transferase
MSEYVLYGFGESGNAYKAALMLQLCKFDWECRKVEFFKGETRTPEYRQRVNEMGEVPVLIHKEKKLTQSGVILDYLAEASRRYGAKSEDERREILRWILFDNHKLTASLASLRFLINFAKTGETEVTKYLRSRANAALKILDVHLAATPFAAGQRLTIADLSMCGYLYFGDELTVPLDVYPHVINWLDKIKSLEGWKHPYALMPRAFEPV